MHMSWSRAAAAAALSGVFLGAIGVTSCARKRDSEPLVAKPALELSRPRAALGSPLDVTYRFTVPAAAPKLAENYRVFAHFVDSNGELMWTDDHDPPVPTSAWQPGQTVEYRRTIFIPIYPYIGEAAVRVGLYRPADNKRVPLVGEDLGLREYKVAALELLPQSENVFLIYRDGWHPAEVARDNAAIEWQWTKKDAVITFRNPKRDATLYLQLDARADLFPVPQKVTVTVNGNVVDQFDATARDAELRRAAVSAAQFGAAEMAELRISVDNTFVPALLPGASSPDTRELGIRVFHVFVEPR